MDKTTVKHFMYLPTIYKKVKGIIVLDMFHCDVVYYKHVIIGIRDRDNGSNIAHFKKTQTRIKDVLFSFNIVNIEDDFSLFVNQVNTISKKAVYEV